MTHNPFNIFDSLPALTKNAIGFDEVFKRLADFSETIPKVTYPPFNIRKTGENTYVLEMAVAGFGKQDIEVVMENGVLTIKGHIENDNINDYIHKGIADRAFTRKFSLADTIEVKNADLINGMLKIWLEQFIPEHAKPRKIEVNATTDVASLSTKKTKETV